MAVEIKMPQLSDTMDQGKILAWKKNIGDTITRGDILAEVETDKANLEIESFNSGTLLAIKTPAGQSAVVGEIIAIIGGADEKVDAGSPNKPSAAPEPIEQTTKQAPQSTPVAAQQPQSREDYSNEGERIKASPLARKIAEQRNIDIANIKGSGPNGRIVKKDLDSADSISSTPAKSNAAVAVQRESKQPAMFVAGSGKLSPLTKMRDTIARRMQESVREAPHFYTTTTVEMTQAKQLRELLKERPEYKGISINHLVIKAVAYAIEKEPRVNNAIKDGQLYQPGQINIGIITAIEDGLLIPVIKETNTLPLKDVVFEARAAVDRARAGRPNSSDLSGGTFSISNMGMFDIESFTAIINPGQGAILAVSSMKEEPIVKNSQIVIGSVMRATVSVDHRIIDGIMAGNFLKYFKEALENPALLML